MKKEYHKIGDRQIIILKELYAVGSATVKYMKLALSYKHSHIVEPAIALCKRGMILLGEKNSMQITELGKEFIEYYNELPEDKPLSDAEKALKARQDVTHYANYFKAGY